jgi:two-component system sensor histidine kinase/response regulator
MTAAISLPIQKVLVVEDSPTQALLLQEALQEEKLDVAVAKDGVDALAQLKQDRPELIISDVEMPRMNGFDLCRHIKEDPLLKEIPVILLTTLSDPMDVIRGMESGADSFLTKPFNRHLLLSNVIDIFTNKSYLGVSKETHLLTFCFGGKKQQLHVNLAQIANLLLSTYSNAIQKNLELERAYRDLNLVNQEIAQKNSELKQLNEQKNHFLGMAAHDMRNPLTVIEGHSNLLIDNFAEKLDEAATKSLQRIQKSSASMLQLINDLLDISAIESGKVSVHLAEVDIKAIVREAIAFQKMLADRKQIQLIGKIDEGVPRIQTDAEKIQQVLSNLIGNAIKFSHPNTVIEVSIERGAKELLFAIKDQGQGIPENEQNRVFQPFTKTSVKGTAGEASTGLGLAITKRIVTELGGRIWLESKVGVGSTFSFTLPMSS